MRLHLRLVAILICLAALLRAEALALASAEFPFRFHDGLLWVKVTTPKAGRPLNFLFDSGAEVSVISLATARRLHLWLRRPVAVRGVGTSTRGFWPQRLHATVGGVPLPSRFLALDLSKLSRSCKEPVDGLIGMDFIRGRVVQIDYKALKIRLLRPQDILDRTGSLPLDVRRCGMRAQASVNGRPAQWFRVDTGCATPLQWVTAAVERRECGAKLAVGLASLNIPQVRTTVDLGGDTFRDVPAGIHRNPIFPGESGLLGNGLLSRFGTVTLDARSGRLLLGR